MLVGAANMALPQLANSVPPPPQVERSPFVPRHLVDLLLSPRSFFTGQLALGKTPYLLAVIWVVGMATAVANINGAMKSAALGGALPDGAQSWTAYWTAAATFGAVAGMLYWLIGGWWFTLRVRWAGATGIPRRRAKLVMIYADFVQAAPIVLLSAVWTLSFPSFAAAYEKAPRTDWLLLLLPFWSTWIGYVGVRAVFGVSGWRPRLWFLILPALFYLLALLPFIGAPGAADGVVSESSSACSTSALTCTATATR
jgi:hypothetical protein